MSPSTGCAESTEGPFAIAPVQYYRFRDGLRLRRESFGGIAYSYDSRRLSFIYSRLAVEVAFVLAEGLSLEEVTGRFGVSRGGQTIADEIQRAVDQLVGSGVLEPCAADNSGPG